MEKEIKICLVLLLLLALCSCKKWIEVPVPKDRVIASRVFENDAKATSAMTAIYGAMINGSGSFVNGSTTLFMAMYADELLKFNPSAAEAEWMENGLQPTNTQVAALWKSAYQVVYYCNAVLEGLQASPSLSAPVRQRLEGEARFLRAFTYSYLANLFGDVPLLTATSFSTNALAPRKAVAGIHDFIKEEVKKARELLPESYPGPERIRPNKWAATALLARVCLYRQEWVEADSAASEVIAAGLYHPLPPLNAVYLKGSREAIWQLSPTNGVLRETASLRPAGSPLAPQYYLTPSLLTAFELGDERRSRWLDSLTYLGQKYYYPGKYRNTAAAVTEYYVVLRLAEQYLVRAEARMNQGRLPDAVSDINIVRTRAGLPPLLTTIGLPQVSTALETERRVELMAEWGHRWFDLNRWDRATHVLQAIKPGWNATDKWLPIPQAEIETNHSLTQNPGY